ncbi:hypothetical protein IGI04_019244 [Brassica rapa subsp. trilocularis]|uniref:Uncharacterized protein n=1 Tax=Brassica rapa subsp. trilocularis TaxID=1813537 RepID=A0ABQ7MG70_BRACM|nr:hypothetical protein IGI04_030148 [Brassica rapa subsp. trilocularis]KAG5397430.1 hypothetical protein IGI04_019244 [Brassica rapa subsp. trilocularis]
MQISVSDPLSIIQSFLNSILMRAHLMLPYISTTTHQAIGFGITLPSDSQASSASSLSYYMEARCQLSIITTLAGKEYYDNSEQNKQPNRCRVLAENFAVEKERINAVSKIRFVGDIVDTDSNCLTVHETKLKVSTYGLACFEKHEFVFYDMLDEEVSKDEVSRDILRLMQHTYRNQGFQLFLSFFEIHGGKRYDLLKERKSVEKHVVILSWLLCT